MEVNIEKLIELKLSLEGYFVLWSLYNEQGACLSRYCKSSIHKIPTRVFEQLVDEKYIDFKGDKDFTLDNMTLTDRFKLEVLGLKDLKATSFDVAFQQLRECYPTKTPSPLGVVDEELHSVILQCINYIVNQATKAKKLDYLQMLPTFLAQKNWETVKDDVEALILKNGFVDKKNLDSGGFMDDV